MRHLLLALIILIVKTASAQLPANSAIRNMPLYPDSIPNSRPTPNEEQTERTKEGVLITSKISRPSLTIFVPKINRHAAVIICPGGGYWVEAAELEGSEFAKRFADSGITAIILKYRIPDDKTMIDRSIGALQDAQQAVLVVRQHAQQWSIDPDHIGIMGFSAGGHLAAMEATHFERPLIPNPRHTSIRPDFLILGYPVITCIDSTMHRGSCHQLIGPKPTRQQQIAYSNELQVTPMTPPTFLVHAADDDGVPPENSILFFQALRRNHVQAELHIYEHSGHGFGMHLNGTTEDWMDRCFHWMTANAWLAVIPQPTPHVSAQKGRLRGKAASAKS